MNEKNGLDIKIINPKNHPKYSPNLFKWLNNRNRKHRKWTSRIYCHNDGSLWIGFIDEGDFIGARLISVLCNGSKEIGGCYGHLSNELTEVHDFWDRYVEIGRCAIDVNHTMYFIDDETRFRIEGDTRYCLWCGEVRQRLKKWTETIKRESWVNE